MSILDRFIELYKAGRGRGGTTGSPAHDDDTKWGQLNTALIESAHRGNWGLYRNTRFEMGELLRKEGRHRQALIAYLEVCYVDQNGPRNTGGIQGIAPFSQADAFVAPGVVKRATSMVKTLSLGEPSVKAIYDSMASAQRINLRLPVSPAAAWNEIRKELFSE